MDYEREAQLVQGTIIFCALLAFLGFCFGVAALIRWVF